MKLIDDKQLKKSSVVANCCMNRERVAFGTNSYEKEIFINPLIFLRNRKKIEKSVRWLDICCGSGNALIQVAKELEKENSGQGFEFIGIDLIGLFAPVPEEITNLKLIESSLSNFDTKCFFDLITSVHGIHYIGDKLGMIRKYIQYLKQDGLFICNIDTHNIFDNNGKKLDRKINSWLRKCGLIYDSRKKLLRCNGRKEITLPFQYSGANEQYGKNYTKQKVVASYYFERSVSCQTGEIA